MSELSFLAIAIGGGCGTCPDSSLQEKWAAVSGIFCPTALWCECSGLSGSGLVGNDVSGSPTNQ